VDSEKNWPWTEERIFKTSKEMVQEAVKILKPSEHTHRKGTYLIF
jgi:hypothetical protein